MPLAILFGLAAAVMAAEPRYELRGQLRPPGRAAVSLFGATTPFASGAAADSLGRFQFRNLLAGSYTLAVFVSGRGEARRTIEVGPGTAGSRRRVHVRIDLGDSAFAYGAVERRHKVDARQLAVPPGAWKAFEQAQKALEQRDAIAARTHLERAVQIAPAFAMAWNTLGTIAYQSREFPRAEECFRRSLEADAGAFEPLVNLGGVLVTTRRLEEALRFNTLAVVARPNDALANSQLGMTYFYLDRLDLARKHLAQARQADPAHFSHPQLLLAEIELRGQNWQGAADQLEDFLTQHPDWPRGDQVRAAIRDLRQRGAP